MSGYIAPWKTIEEIGCFVCERKLDLFNLLNKQDTSIRRDLCLRFRTLASRFVNISNSNINNNHSIVINNRPNGNEMEDVFCCESCYPSIEIFCEMYEGWNNLQLEIIGLLDKISNMKCKENQDYQKVQASQSKVFKFWKKFPAKVEQKRIHSLPKLSLKNLGSQDIEEMRSKLKNNFCHYGKNEKQSQDFPIQTITIDDVEEDDCDISSSPIPSPICPDAENDNGDFNIPRHDDVGVHDHEPADISQGQANLNSAVEISTEPKRENQIKFQCVFCGKLLYAQHLLNRHLNLHILEKSHICKICHAEFIYKGRLRRHLIRVHKNTTNPLQQLLCDICSKPFKTPWTVSMHRFWKHKIDDFLPDEKKMFHCEFCKMKFSKRMFAAMHKKQMHAIESGCEFRPFQCEKCPWAFKTKGHLNRHHAQKHNDAKPFLCTLCGRSFKFDGKLRYHEKMDHSSIHCKCNICGKQFGSKKGKDRHVTEVHKMKKRIRDQKVATIKMREYRWRKKAAAAAADLAAQTPNANASTSTSKAPPSSTYLHNIYESSSATEFKVNPGTF